MKLTKPLLIILVFYTVLLFFYGCNNRWEKLNSNPNSVTGLPNGFLFSSAVRDSFLDELNTIQAYFGGQLAHIVVVDYPGREIDKYYFNYSRDFSESIFKSVYGGAIRNIVEVLDATSKGATENNARNAQAKVIAAVNFAKLTDLFGDVPYFQAAQAKNANFTPAYDPQQEIYGDMVEQLIKARAVLNSATNTQIYPVEFDPLYAGNLESWKRFANSFLLRLAIRARLADPDKYNPIIQECLSFPLVEENTDNAKLANYDVGNSDLYNPWYTKIIDYQGGKYTALWSEYFVNTLKDLKDPRLVFFATPNKEGEFIGFPNGLVDAPDYAKWLEINKDLAKFSPKFVARDQPLYLLTAGEIWLLRADMAINNIGGLASADANKLYRNGIVRALQQWNLPNDSIEKYMSNQQVTTLSGTMEEKQDQISTQLWIAYIPNFVESWTTIRRTGFPKIKQRTEPNYSKGDTDGYLPKRLRYPYTVEKISNGNNLKLAVDRMGGIDKIDIPVWWDVID